MASLSMEPADKQAARPCEHLAEGQSEPWCDGLTGRCPVVAADSQFACRLLSLCMGAAERLSAFTTDTATAEQGFPVSTGAAVCRIHVPPPRRALGLPRRGSRCSVGRLQGGDTDQFYPVQVVRGTAGTSDNGAIVAAARPTSTPSVRHTTWPTLRPPADASVRVASDSPDGRIRSAPECRSRCPADC